MLFVIQIGSASSFALARDIDPAYARAFDKARAAGVEALAWTCKLTEHDIVLDQSVPIEP
jgi:sugar fermentation stimulation protein A